MMNDNVSRNEPSALFTSISISLFFIVLGLPLAQMILSVVPEMATHENRTLAQMPHIQKMGDLRNYNKNFEIYFNDHYGFRSYLVRLNSFLHLTAFNTSPTRRVIIGEQGWLWYDDPRDGVNLKDFYGGTNFNAEELKRIKDNILHMHKELQKIKIHFLLVVAPNKHTIYPEYLPANIQQLRGRITQLDQVTQVLNNSGVDFIDLRSKLLTEKERTTYPLYYRTDTHWNNIGAFFDTSNHYAAASTYPE